MTPEPQAKAKHKLQGKYQLTILKITLILQKRSPSNTIHLFPETDQSFKSVLQHVYWGPKSGHPWLQETELTAVKNRRKSGRGHGRGNHIFKTPIRLSLQIGVGKDTQISLLFPIRNLTSLYLIAEAFTTKPP